MKEDILLGILFAVPKTPNPKSKTKKQKAFDEAYARWLEANNKNGDYFYYERTGKQAYKKWLYEQQLANQHKFVPPPGTGDRIGYYPPGSDKLEWITVKDKDGFIPWNGGEIPVGVNEKVQIKQRNGYEDEGSAQQFDWEHAAQNSSGLKHLDIVAFKIVEEPKQPLKIQWECVYTPWKVLFDSYDYVKTDYTFWLGQDGSISDE